MPGISEEQIINKLQSHYDDITGMTSAYTFANNPDSLSNAQLPATLFVPQQTRNILRGHHNDWRTDFTILGNTFVISREAKGGKLAFLENAAIGFMLKIRQKFTTDSVVRDVLSLGFASAYTFTCRYGAGGELLTIGGIPYIGVITTFEFQE